MLDKISVATPCPANWDGMTGDDRVRFCGECRLNVYNLSGMTRHEAETLVKNHEGRLCVRYFQREDGSILTKDCPVGLRILHRRRAKIRTGGIAAAVTLVTALGIFSVQAMAGDHEKCPIFDGENTQQQQVAPPIHRMGEAVAPGVNEIMGDLAVPPDPPLQNNGQSADTPDNPVPPRHIMGKVRVK